MAETTATPTAAELIQAVREQATSMRECAAEAVRLYVLDDPTAARPPRWLQSLASGVIGGADALDRVADALQAHTEELDGLGADLDEVEALVSP